jgi:pyrroloquinoline quinone (PQQ) biosynthesis protein C
MKSLLKKSYDVFWTFLEAFKTGMEIHRVEYLYEKSTRGAKPRQ